MISLTEFRPRHWAGVCIAAALIASILVGIQPAAADDSIEFDDVGANNWTVPTGVESVVVTAIGGAGSNGGSPNGSDARPGAGALVTGVVAMSSADAVQVNVGGNADGSSGGWNGGGDAGGGDSRGFGGGAGGGASDIRINGTTLDDRVLVAGGGGGGGGSGGGVGPPPLSDVGFSASGGTGGSAGTNDGAGSAGATGGTNGGAGGAAGVIAGGTGSSGQDGQTLDTGGGGGGGGGYLGGAGGSGGRGGNGQVGHGGGGGGAGSSYVDPVVVSAADFGTAGLQESPSVTIDWVNISTTTLGPLSTGAPVSIPLQASFGGGEPVSWNTSGGSLPAGLTLTDGTIAGTPTGSGPYSVTLSASSAGAVSAVTLTGTVTGAPVITNTGVSGLTTDAATLNGTVTAAGSAISSIYCKYATTADGVASGTQVTANPSNVDSSAINVPFQCDLSELSANRTYYYALFAVDMSGTGATATQSFQTSNEVPTVHTAAATQVTATSALGVGTVDPHNGGATVSCQVATSAVDVPTAPLVNATPPTVSSGWNALPVTCALPGLITGTTYYYRVIASNSEGQGAGSIESFTTGASRPFVQVGPATSIAGTSAVGNGAVTAANEPVTDIYCRYAESADGVPAGQVVQASPQTAPATAANLAITCDFTDLLPETTYYYATYAVDGDGTGASATTASFTTTPAEPTLAATGATAVTANSAVAGGSATTANAAITNLECRVAKTPAGVADGAAGAVTPTSVGALTVNEPITCLFGGLAANQTYYYAIFGTVGSSEISSGTPVSFTTGLTKPQVTVEEATAVGANSAVGNALVTANNSRVTSVYCKVARTPEQINGSTPIAATPTTLNARAVDRPVSCPLTGLDPAETYFYRAYAVNAQGTTASGTAEFETAALPPIVQTLGATSVATTSATGNGTVTTTDEAATQIYCRIAESEPGVATGTQVTAEPASLPSSPPNQPVTCGFTDLTPGTTYFYRVFAVDADGTGTSTNSAAFQTVSTAPIVTTSAATSVLSAMATGSGTVNPNGYAVTNVWCVVSLQPNLSGSRSFPATPRTVGSSAPTTTVSCPMTNLTAGTSYYYQVQATSGGGTDSGATLEFRTTGRSGPPVVPPRKLKRNGVTTLLGQPSYSSSGALIRVAAKLTGRGDARCFRLIRRSGAVYIRTFGRSCAIRITYAAPATPGGSAYRLVRNYVV